MKALGALALVIILLVLGFILIKPYRSAFEADQACHYDQRQEIESNQEFDCDHDLETRQWLLYQRLETEKPAKVIKRYRY